MWVQLASAQFVWIRQSLLHLTDWAQDLGVVEGGTANQSSYHCQLFFLKQGLERRGSSSKQYLM